MTCHAFDASAIGSVESVCSRPLETFDVIGDLIRQGEAVFCDEVLGELEWLYAESIALTWAKAIRAARFHKAADYLRVEALGALLPEVVDETSTKEVSALNVLAQAQELADDYGIDELCIVTEDWGEKPTRVSLGDACLAVDMCGITLSDFLQAIGRADLIG
jgi:hypothetical protein